MTLWPWLSRRTADIDFFQLAFNRSVFTTLLLSWNYVKASNRAVADVLQREIDEEAKKTKSMDRAPLLAGTCVCSSSAVSFPRLAMAIVRMEPCLVDLQWRLLADNTELTSWASNCKHARRFENQEYRACKPAQPTCTPAARCARQHKPRARMHVDLRASTSHVRACTSICTLARGTCAHAD